MAGVHTMTRTMMMMLVCSAVLVQVQAVISDSDDISCAQVNLKLTPCVGYVENEKVQRPPGVCCDGVKVIAALGKTKEERVALCKCLKEALGNLGKHPIPDRVSGLPKACGVDDITMPPIQDDNFNCSTVSYAA